MDVVVTQALAEADTMVTARLAAEVTDRRMVEEVTVPLREATEAPCGVDEHRPRQTTKDLRVRTTEDLRPRDHMVQALTAPDDRLPVPHLLLAT